jgi:GTP-binding protein
MLPGTFLPGERRSKTIELYLVDLPGYGYAKVSGEILQQWPALIEPYLQSRSTLAASVLLIDAMVPPQASDLDLYHWLSRRGRRVQVVATKCDRLSKNQRRSAIKNLEEAFGSPILAFSARTSEGREALLQAITSWLI